MNQLTFDQETHTYKADGVIVPSVTQVIKAAGCLPMFAPGDWHMTKGSHVHLATQLYDEGDLDEDTLDPVIVPYLTAYKRFREETDFTPTEIELSLCSQTYGYAGTIDRIGTMNNTPVLIDIKTGAPYAAVALQCAAYLNLVHESGYSALKVYVLYLKDTGKYTLIQVKVRSAFPVFLSALTIYKWKSKEGLLNGNSNRI